MATCSNSSYGVLLAALSGAFAVGLPGQDPAPPGGGTPTETEARLETLEDELELLRAELQQHKAETRIRPEPDPVTLPPIEIHGFGHFRLGYDYTDREGSPPVSSNEFASGHLDLFLTSQITERISFLSETALHFTSSGSTSINVHRLNLRYDLLDWLTLKVGRLHTSLGYWNETYHHGEWLQTSVGRPAILSFRGILPIHLNGVQLEARHDTDAGLWDLTVEAANGRGRTQLAQQRTADANRSKAVNARLFFEPSGIPGLRVGGGAMFDDIPPNTTPGSSPLHGKLEERILSAHVAYTAHPVEALVEFFHVAHEQPGPDSGSWGLYAQLGYKLDTWTPYVRYDRVRVDDRDTYFDSRNDLEAFTGGIRWDFADYNALTLQLTQTLTDAANGAADTDKFDAILQWSFAF